jgi:glycerate 2-kinase
LLEAFGLENFMAKIQNLPALVANGQNQLSKIARTLALESLEAAINAADPKKIVSSKVVLKDNILRAEQNTFNLSQYERIFVVGGGKAAAPMAQAIEEILGSRITDGTVNVQKGCQSKTAKITLNFSSHPLPDEEGVVGTKKMLEIAKKASASDLVVSLISGGGSSLMSYPREGISVMDLQKLTTSLLRSGATISEVNAVRKHTSGFKGGWLAKIAYPATILNLILSDVVGDPLDVIASAPTVPDPTTFRDAHAVLEKYGLWQNCPDSVKKVITQGEEGLLEETPKPGDPVFEKAYNIVIGNNRTAAFAASQYLKSKGLNNLLLTTTLEGEARCVGTFFATIANEILASDHPLAKPCAIIVGGETTVTVKANGLGGRNQEIALAASLKIKGRANSAVVVASMGTDGIDGPTDAAGAIIDAKTQQRAETLGLTSEEFLAKNDAYNFFSKLGDLIFTGQTGTNVNDISLIVVL